MILNVNPCSEYCHDADGTDDRPFMSLRAAFHWLNEHANVIDWRVRYYNEMLNTWEFLR
jgi:hypothetical protein